MVNFLPRTSRRRLLTLAVFLGLVVTKGGARGDGLEEIQPVYREKLSKIEEPIVALVEGYLGRLQLLAGKADGSGNRERHEAIQAEIENLTGRRAGNYVPGEDLFSGQEDLLALNAVFQSHLQTRKNEIKAAKRELMEAYCRGLKGLEEERTRAKDLEGAVSLRREREKILQELEGLEQEGTEISGTIRVGYPVGFGQWNGEPFGISARLRNKRLVKVIASNLHWLALGEDGRVYSQGLPGASASVAGDWEDDPPAGLSGIVDIAARNQTNLALSKRGRLTIWGNPALNVIRDFPGRELGEVVKMGCTRASAVAVNRGGKATIWGDFFQQGYEPPPTALEGVVDVAAGANHIFLFKANGEVLHLGKTRSQVMEDWDAREVEEVSEGWDHILVRMKDGTLRIGGGGYATALDLPGENVRATRAIATGFFVNYVETVDGKPISWGMPIQAFQPETLHARIGLTGLAKLDQSGNAYAIMLQESP